MIFYYSGRTTPIEQNSAEVLGGATIMLSYDVMVNYSDQQERLERIWERRTDVSNQSNMGRSRETGRERC